MSLLETSLLEKTTLEKSVIKERLSTCQVVARVGRGVEFGIRERAMGWAGGGILWRP